jgi:hypothetical protein
LALRALLALKALKALLALKALRALRARLALLALLALLVLPALQAFQAFQDPWGLPVSCNATLHTRALHVRACTLAFAWAVRTMARIGCLVTVERF